MSFQWSTVQDSFILVGRTWIRTSEIVSIRDEFNERTAPPQWTGSIVALRNGQEFPSNKNAKQLLDLMTPGDPR